MIAQGGGIYEDIAGELYVMNADGSGKTRMTHDGVDPKNYDPTWSADGKITWVRAPRLSSPELWQMNADGTNRVQLTYTPYVWESGPDWSPTPFASPAARAVPDLSGEPRVGRWLSASAGVWQGRVPLFMTFTWQRCNAAGASCSRD